MNWYEYYKSRVNSNYQQKFEKKYKSFLDLIEEQNSPYIKEMGCGIGSVSKYFLKKNYTCCGYDISQEMVDLANTNVNQKIFTTSNIFDDILNKSRPYIGVSHGVLEHFTDEEIKYICNNNPNSIHYVPLDKYEIPSFGDERLLSYRHWINLVNPEEYIIFNNGYDLAFRI